MNETSPSSPRRGLRLAPALLAALSAAALLAPGLRAEEVQRADLPPLAAAPPAAAPAPVEPAQAPAAPAGPAPGPQAAPAAPAPKAPPKPAQAAPAPAQVAAPKPKPAPPPEPTISQDPRPSYHPDSAGMILQAADLYGAIVARGGWPMIPEGPAIKPGGSSPLIPLVRQRLAIEGDLTDIASDEVLDPALAAAIRRFQARHGLPASGILGPATVKAMNVPAEDRQRALLFSAQRLAASEFRFGPRHIVVNIPSAAVEAIDNGAVTRRYVAVVGDPDHPSPTVEAKVGAINFNPTWTVPVSIIKNEIIPKMRKDPGYLAKSRIRMLDAQGQEVDPARIDWSTERAVNFTLRQDPGVGNSLGVVRISMPNRHSVYMHDTPSKRLFGRDMRFLSHGCVRVAGVLDLATWLLGPQGWDRPAVDAAVASNERKDVNLRAVVPVAWVYLTGFVTPDGTVNFREDVYKLDRPEPSDLVTTATIAPVTR
jgi:murein L,D-transpeptidase YcbB/YkuD